MPEAKSTGKSKRVIASSRLIRGARAALGLSQDDLAGHAGVSRETLNALENGKAVSDRSRESLQLALEARGVEFTNGNEPGFKLKDGA
jgi:DNA-binding XRE family transcriptional regulator